MIGRISSREEGTGWRAHPRVFERWGREKFILPLPKGKIKIFEIFGKFWEETYIYIMDCFQKLDFY